MNYLLKIRERCGSLLNGIRMSVRKRRPDRTYFENLIIANKRRTAFLVGLVLFVLAIVWACFALIFQMPDTLLFGKAWVFGWPQVGIVCGGTILTLLALLAWSLTTADENILSLMGGKRVAHYDDAELLNVVEEISIAARIHAPQIYVINSPEANAFALGWKGEQGKIAITSKLRSMLTRDELSGVLAHEIAHICNRDTMLNSALVALCEVVPFLGQAFVLASQDSELQMFLRGLVKVIGWLGELVAKVVQKCAESKSWGLIFFAGLLLLGVFFLIAFICVCFLMLLASLVVFVAGHFASLMSRFAISREREYLADASAVKFTRHPMAIASALRKLATLDVSSKALPSTLAPLLFFRKQESRFLANWLSTHPPLDERVRRIEALCK